MAAIEEWPVDEVDEMVRLWELGYTAGRIAKKMATGRTRSAIQGKLHRLGIKRADNPISKKITIPKPKPKKVKPKPILAGEPVRIHGEPIKLLDLKEGMCKWPIGDPQERDFHFCGRPTSAIGVYCPGHKAVAYQPNSTMNERKR